MDSPVNPYLRLTFISVRNLVLGQQRPLVSPFPPSLGLVVDWD